MPHFQWADDVVKTLHHRRRVSLQQTRIRGKEGSQASASYRKETKGLKIMKQSMHGSSTFWDTANIRNRGELRFVHLPPVAFPISSKRQENLPLVMLTQRGQAGQPSREEHGASGFEGLETLVELDGTVIASSICSTKGQSNQSRALGSLTVWRCKDIGYGACVLPVFISESGDYFVSMSVSQHSKPFATEYGTLMQ